jgi:DMSO/TMAO reductase YedYZ molybdopterin-dependent catalytic subunit
LGTKTKQKNLATILILTLIVTALAATTTVTADTQWNLQVTNLTGTSINMTYQDLTVFPKITVYAELACYGAPLASGNWDGALLSDILNQVGIDQSTTSVDFKASDGYVVSLPIATAMRSDVIVAYGLDGALLGETLRLVVPGANGNIWISAITSIKMNNQDLVEGISGNPNLTALQQYQSSTNTTTQVSPSQPPKTQPPPTPNPATTTPTVAPSNASQPQTEQKAPWTDSVFSVGTVYLVLAVVAVVAFAVGFAVYTIKRMKA